MGSFTLLPFMECRHSVRSMRHSVKGDVCINGQKYLFRDALGYWEGDVHSLFAFETDKASFEFEYFSDSAI